MNLTVIGQSLAEKLAGDSSDQCIQDNGAFCFNWIAENFSDRYVTPTLEHLYLVGISVILGFVVAMGMAVLSHRRRWLVPPLIGFTGILYTIPSVALFFLLLPITGRGNTTAIVALTGYTLLILFRNVVDGLDGVSEDTRDAARGMGLTDRELLWRVEVPLAAPTILAGLRIAFTTTVGLAALAFFAGAGGLGEQLNSDMTFKSNVMVAGGLCVLLAAVLDGLVLLVQRVATPWARVGVR
jgi:osmoprotectant transport system permease protein